MNKDKRPLRDNRGRFVKGHEPLVRPKYELMREYPALICDTCYKKDVCAEYKADSVCTYKREFKRYMTRNLNDVIEELRATTEASYAEMTFYIIQENITGEYNPAVTKLVNKNFKRLFLLYQIYKQIENRKPLYNPKKENILDKLFDFNVPVEDDGIEFKDL